MTKEYENESSTPDDRLFIEHLEQASRIVRSWPVWKQRVLGHIIDSDEKTCPDSEHAEGPPRISFSVDGKAVPQGSKSGFIRGGRVIMRESSKYHKPWRKKVANEAKQAMANTPRLEGAITLEVDFYFARPKSHHGTGRNASTLKASAPVDHLQAPDLDKLVRSINDSLTGICFEDDSQVTSISARKHWSDYGLSYVTVTVEELL